MEPAKQIPSVCPSLLLVMSTALAAEEKSPHYTSDRTPKDMALMRRLGIMNGVGAGRFDPLGTYTKEQCFISLLRLYENGIYTVTMDLSTEEQVWTRAELDTGGPALQRNSGREVLLHFSAAVGVYHHLRESSAPRLWTQASHAPSSKKRPAIFKLFP